MLTSMNSIVPEKYLTPYKFGKPVISPSGQKGAFDSECVDIPFVFYHNHQFYMMYVGYNGQGYQTALAVSSDLIHWESLGVILGKGDSGRWDSVGSAGTWILKDENFSGLPSLKKVDGKYWMIYHSYPQDGYEEGPAEIGLAWTEDENLLVWHRLEQPVYSWREGAAWESGGLYKACIIEHDGLFHMFYNAKTADKRWIEQIGLATSPDLLNWSRYPENPIVKVTPEGWDSQFASDPCIVRDEDKWVMYYFGYNLRHAQDGIAFSDNLYEWHKNPEPIVKFGEPGDIDDIHAHKASIIKYNGVLYHFYCAARKFQEGDPACNFGVEFRCISVATSSPL